MRCGAAATISGPRDNIITHNPRQGSSLALTNIVVDETTGPVYAEFKLISPLHYSSMGGVQCCFGAMVREEGMDLDESYAQCKESYVMSLDSGIVGNLSVYAVHDPLWQYSVPGQGATVGVYAKVGEQGFVRFYLNGKESKTVSYKSGRQGPYVSSGYVPTYPKGTYGPLDSPKVGPIKSPLVIAMKFRGLEHKTFDGDYSTVEPGLHPLQYVRAPRKHTTFELVHAASPPPLPPPSPPPPDQSNGKGDGAFDCPIEL